MRQIVALGSLKGAAGASTLALALAAAWPRGGGVRPVVVEADASGGDLAVRFGLSDMVGLLALAAGARQGGPERDLDGCTQEVAGGLQVVVAPTGADQALASVAEVAACPSVLRGDAGSEGTVLLDLGHLGAAPSRELARAADRLVLVARGSADALAHVAARPEWLEGARPELAVVGPCRYSESDIAQALEMDRDQIHLLPWDVRAADAFAGAARVAEGRWRRSPLARAVFVLARQLAGADSGVSRGGLCGELAQLGSRALPRPLLGRSGALRSLEKGGTR
ncbi:MinD/ParA family ATP-binding protein [Streptomyces kaempferi]|uniref:MinD/ParA family protein n=1 Tax=Streptomyces kaempferi TaxID=333725 RepID=A0ABW3XJH3_9ACTN